MKKMLLLCGTLLAMSASVAAANDLNIAWDTCLGDGGTQLKTFSCLTNSNAGANLNVINCSVTMSADMLYYQGSQGYISITTTGAIPAWWGNGCAGKTSPFGNLSVPGCTVALDPYQNNGLVVASGTNGITYPSNGDVRVMRMQLFGAGVAGFETNLLAGSEYQLYALNMNNAKSVGTGSCVGCATPAAIKFYQMDTAYLSAPYPGGTPIQSIITTGAVQQTIFWQAPTAARNATWGSVKALYR